MKTQIKNNKALFVLPMALLPFVVLIFYILGGGQGQEARADANSQSGANTQLPDADRNIEILDKKEAYMQREQHKEVKTISLNVDTPRSISGIQLNQALSEEESHAIMQEHMTKEAEKARAALVPHQKNKQTQSLSINKVSSGKTKPRSSKSYNHDTNQNRTIATKYPFSEYEELHSLISEHERLMRENDSLHMQIQMANVELKQQAQKEALKVEVLNQGAAFGKSTHTVIRAQILEDSKVMSGHRIMLRLMDNVTINNHSIRANTIIYGLCKTSQERLHIQVVGLPLQGNQLRVQLSAYDMDGIKGLYVPDNTARKVYKDVAGRTNPSVLFTPDGNALSYMGMNAANNAARAMFKRVRQQKVHLRKNTILILKNE